jgi:hypothetical protein
VKRLPLLLVLLGLTLAPSAQAATFTPLADGYVRADQPTTVYALGGSLQADAAPLTRSFLRWDVQGAYGDVTRATLRLYALSGSSTGFEVRAVAGTSWSEGALTHATAPAPSATVTASSGPFAAGSWLSLDVTPLVTGNGPVALALVPRGTVNLSLGARESRYRPELVVETVGGPPAAVSPPPVTGEARVGRALVAGPGAWTGAQPLTFDYRWRRCRADGGGCVDVPGETAPEHVLVPADAGQTLRVTVTALNAAGQAAQESGPSPVVRDPAALLADGFDTPNGPNGLIASEYATANPGDATAVRSPTWTMPNGSFFSVGGMGWSGPPDDCTKPDRYSASCTSSAAFRLRTHRMDLGDVDVGADVRLDSLGQTPRYPAVNWDGLHFWLRLRSEAELYDVSVMRRDGQVVIKKKCPGGTVAGGTYHQLAYRTGHPIRLGEWEHVGATARTNADGSVTLSVLREGRVLVEVTDPGVGCPALNRPGAVGVRGDNADFRIEDLRVTAR